MQTEIAKNTKALEDCTKRLNEEKAVSMDLRKKLGTTSFYWFYEFNLKSFVSLRYKNVSLHY